MQKITKSDASEDALLTESALLGPDNPANAGLGYQDKQGEALVIPAKTEVGGKMINETRGTVTKGLPSLRRKMAYEPPVGGKRRAPPGTAARMAAMAAKKEEQKKQKRTASSLKILPSYKNLQSWEYCCQWYRLV